MAPIIVTAIIIITLGKDSQISIPIIHLPALEIMDLVKKSRDQGNQAELVLALIPMISNSNSSKRHLPTAQQSPVNGQYKHSLPLLKLLQIVFQILDLTAELAAPKLEDSKILANLEGIKILLKIPRVDFNLMVLIMVKAMLTTKMIHSLKEARAITTAVKNQLIHLTNLADLTKMMDLEMEFRKATISALEDLMRR